MTARRCRRPRLLVLPVVAAALAACAIGPAAASASTSGQFAPAITADGPSVDVLALGGVGLARDDTTGGVAYLKRDAGQSHVFVSPLVRGNPTAPVRVDTGQVNDSSEVRVASGDRGRTAVVWINGGLLYGAVKGADSPSFGPPTQICTCGPVAELSVGMSIFGATYVTFTTAGAGGHDIRAAVLDNGGWTTLPQPIDVDPNRDARGARLAVSSDGTAIVAWTETGGDGVSHVFERRLLHGTPSNVPREAGVGSLSGRPGGSADSPAVDVQDDSTFAWVALRQDFNDGGVIRSRVIARRLVGSNFESPVQIDGLAFPSAQNPEHPLIDITGRGYGMALSNMRSSFAITGAVLTSRKTPVKPTFEPTVSLDAGPGAPPFTTIAASEDRKGIAAWQRTANGSTSILARYYDGVTFRLPSTLSPPAYGGSAADLGLDAASDGAGDSVVAFVQGGATQRRIQVVAFVGPLTVSRVSASRRWIRNRRPSMHWTKTAAGPWGPIQYRLEVDGSPLVTTAGTSFTPVKPLGDGVHAVRVVAIDGRGTETDGRDVALRIDTTKPKGRWRSLGGGVYSVSASDGSAIHGSGIASARLVFGGSSVRVPVARIGIVQNAKVRHSGGGRPRLVLVDKAGNKRTIR
jgi:hypothetical protein